MSAKKSNQKKIKKEDIFGLKSYTDGAEMWKFITSELVPLQTPMEFLNDNSFEKRIASDIIETWLSYKNQEISAEDFNYYLNLICQTDYLVGFNFSLYSEKADKWYSSIFEWGGEIFRNESEEHNNIHKELDRIYNFEGLISKTILFIKNYYKPSDSEELLSMLEKHWDDFEYEADKHYETLSKQ
jgi:hypothetical protein